MLWYLVKLRDKLTFTARPVYKSTDHLGNDGIS
jgi:hypothetical protein